jgi:hypothetical protein
MEILEAIGFTTMGDVLLVVSHLMLVIGVLGLVGIVLVAGLYEIVQNKVQELRRQDGIASETGMASPATSIATQH